VGDSERFEWRCGVFCIDFRARHCPSGNIGNYSNCPQGGSIKSVVGSITLRFFNPREHGTVGAVFISENETLNAESVHRGMPFGSHFGHGCDCFSHWSAKESFWKEAE
jgi:hypothetical protein